jgi:hypothetical protein
MATNSNADRAICSDIEDSGWKGLWKIGGITARIALLIAPAAINLYGCACGLPPAISGMNSNWLRGYGNSSPHTIIAVGLDHDFLNRNFVSCTWAANPGNPYGVVNETIGDVYVCGAPRQGLPEFWKLFQAFG